ncbi:hypothetical protein Rhopal_003803-T1 [Rhodotorula paludigena]|uniref:Membrane anchor Opy2 N-terminal domain-containing protein n=1 Tax=Rhodotorula paludigena TaxID=86838 RepID=A0AAV5GJY7_9BASI|nr:hypothetical protein Rhopal_003803-T1 [Rhodotorula paludigena]
MSSNLCDDTSVSCPTCDSGQHCEIRQNQNNGCRRYVCVDSDTASKSSGGGTNVGATAGGAVGGVLGVAVVLTALYFFWWKPRGLAASRKRYSRHLSQRQSRIADKRRTQQLGPDGAAAGAAGENDAVTKRSSVHLHMDGGGEAVNRRNTSPGNGHGALVTGRTSDDDNPFGDQNRSSIGSFNDANSIHTSEFSFRSSHTNVIPIAYIPPHSSSMSIADAHRGAYGESGDERRDSALPPPRSPAARASIPTSMASRDSLALAGAEIIELNPLPPVLTPDTPAVPLGTTVNGAPIRPPRSPGLDLKLPNTPKVSSPLAGAPLGSPDRQPGRPTSSAFPLPSPPPPAGSSATSSPTTPSFLSAAAAGGRGMSFLADPPHSRAQAHMSTMTTRSGTSTMSYILDPPQIITPVSAQGVRRVELQKGQAGLVKIGASGPGGGAAGAASPGSPTSEAGSVDPFDDSNRASLVADKRASQDTVKGSAGGLSRPTSGTTDTSRWTASSLASDASEAVQFLQGQTVTFTNPNSPQPPSAPLSSNSRLINTASQASFDVPQSARSSEAYDTGEQVRPLTANMSAWSPSPSPSLSSLSAAAAEGGPALRVSSPSSASMSPSTSRDSTASAATDGSHLSLLEGIPFMTSPGPSASSGLGRGPSTSSVSLGMPVNVTAPLDGTGSTRQPSIISNASGNEDDDPLPAPFLPFAGQRPTSSSTPSASPSKPNRKDAERVQSAAISVRSGFGSGLSQIPFQLGFPSGFGDDDGFTDAGDEGRSERGSFVAPSEGGRASFVSAAEDGEEVEDEDEPVVVVAEAVKTAVPAQVAAAVPETATGAAASDARTEPPHADEDDASNPFGSHAEVAPSAATADPRASTDSLALAMSLSASLEAAEGSKA